jgi:predicted nuclease with TOPRIM domain
MQQNAILSVVMDDLLELDNISLIKFFIKMKRQLTSILLFSALLMGGASTFVSCTDHESDAAYNTSISIADAVTKQIEALKTADQLLQANIDALKNGEVKANKDKIAALEGQVAANTAAIQRLTGTTDNLTQQYTQLNTRLQESIGTLNGKADKTELDELKATVNGITGSLPGKLQELNQAIQDIAGLRTDVNNANNKADELKDRLDSLTDELNRKLGTLDENINTLGEAINGINGQLSTMQGQLDNIVKDVANLKSAIADILNKGVTGIEIQATDCPVTGYENAAFLGAQANILSAYWGAPSTGDEEFGVEGGKIIKSDAGNIYININPANVDPSAITFRLVDSQGNDAPGFKLGAPVITDKVLKYGISRATSANGFYAIPVECTDPQNDGLELNKGQLKEAAKNVLAKLQHPKSTNLNLSGLATALYSNINNKLTAYGIQASWKQKDETGKEVDKVVTSKINLAAFAVKPLSFNFLANNSKLDNLSLDRFMFPTGMKEKLNGINGIDFNNIIDPSTGKTIEVATVVAVPGVKVVANGNDLDFIQISDNKKLNTIKNAYIVSEEVANKDISIEVNGESGSTTLTTYIYEIKVKDDTMKKLIADLNSNLSTTLGPVKTAIDWANTFAGKYDAVVPTVNNLIKKIEGIIHNANKFLQPAMLFKSSNGNWGFVSTGHRFATSFVGVGATPLVATTYTAELLAPAYKKQLYVKEAGAEILVNGKATKAPFNGEIQKVVFNASKAGNYTIVYKAIDYSGKVVEKNFYVTVK